MRATLASLRLAQHDPQAAAALAPVIDGSAGVQPFSVVAALLLEAMAHDAVGDQAAAGRALERALDLAGPNSVLMACSSTRRRSCSSAIPGSAPRAPSLIAGVLSLLAAASRLAAPPGEPQRLREPISQAETRVLRYLHGGDQGCRPTTGRPPPSAVVRQASGQAFPGRTGDRPSRGGSWRAGRRPRSEGSSLTPFRLGGVNHQNM